MFLRVDRVQCHVTPPQYQITKRDLSETFSKLYKKRSKKLKDFNELLYNINLIFLS